MLEQSLEPGALAGRSVLFLNWKGPDHPAAGGSEAYCWALASRLAEAGVMVTLLTSRPRGAASESRLDGVRILRRGGTFGVYLHAALFLLRRRRMFAAVVDCQNGIPFFSPLFLPARTAIVLVIHHVHQDQFVHHFGPVLAWVGRLLEGPASRWVYGRRPVVAVSPSTRAEVRLRLRLRGPILVVPNGADGSPGGAEPLRQRAADPELLFVGRLVPHKRVDRLLLAMPGLLRRWPRLHVSIAGDGPARAALESLSQELGVAGAVTFHGRISESDRTRLLARAWLAVLPSEREGWGLTVIESNAAGLPVVGCHVPGVRDAIRHEQSGWLVRAPHQLEAGIGEALGTLASPAEAARMARTCRAWAGSFRWRASAQRLADILAGEVQCRAARGAAPRTLNDCVVVATVEGGATPEEIRPRVRYSDTCQPIPGGVKLTLAGSDSLQAVAILRRLGVRGAAAVRVALSDDLLGIVPPAAREDQAVWWRTVG